MNFGPPPPRDENSRFRSPPRGGGGGGSSDGENRVHVGNLAWGVDNLALESLFREQGEVLEAKVIYDRESGRSRGFGFVTFSSPEEVNSAIRSLDGAVSIQIPPLCNVDVLSIFVFFFFCYVSVYSKRLVNQLGLFIHMLNSNWYGDNFRIQAMLIAKH